MKHLFVKNIIILLFTSSIAMAQTNNFYLKGTIGANKIKEFIETKPRMEFTTQQHSEISPSLAIGLGYYFNKTFRSDIELGWHSISFQKAIDNFSYFDGIDESFITGALGVKRQSFINSIMLNNYANIYTRDNFKLFVGIGIGAAKIKEQTTYLSKGNIIKDDQTLTFPLLVDSSTTKSVYNLSYSFIIGSEIEVTPDVKCDLTYSWKDFGKTKPITNEIGDIPTKNHYRGHNIALGIRFDL